MNYNIDLNKAIIFLNNNNITDIRYLDKNNLIFKHQEKDIILFDHKRCCEITENQIIALALEFNFATQKYVNKDTWE